MCPHKTHHQRWCIQQKGWVLAQIKLEKLVNVEKGRQTEESQDTHTERQGAMIGEE